MAIDTPARIAILGAGPIGLEAALYARYLGYDVDLYERGQLAEHLLRWGHLRMFTRFGSNSSPLGLAALKAQDPAWQPPPADAVLTGHEFRQRYLVPLASSDLLADSLHLGSEVLAVGRCGWLRAAGAGSEDRADSDFRLLIRTVDAAGHAHETYHSAQAVLDTSGTYGTPNWLGPDGLPAAGETAAHSHIEYGLPDVLAADRPRYAGRNILLVGDGDSAASTLVSLAQLAAQTPDTWITWLTRTRDCLAPVDALHPGLVGRDRIRQQAAQLAVDDANHVTHLNSAAVEAIHWHADLDRFTVRYTRGEQTSEDSFDRVIANVGYRPNVQLCQELQLDVCPVTGAARTFGESPVATSEPDFYVLGAKSRGRDSLFTIADGLVQIRQVFAILGDRVDLDLYASVANLA